MSYMPFPKNWMEELVAEYLQLEDYHVETGCPVPIKKRGGRAEMDVVGIKIIKDKLHVRHVEIGRAGSYKELDQKIERQLLSQEIKEELKKRFGTYEYEPVFISEVHKERSQEWQNLKKKYESKNVKLMTFKELFQEIQRVMKEWKQKHRTTSVPMLPENLWLLKMLERINEVIKSNNPIK